MKALTLYRRYMDLADQAGQAHLGTVKFLRVFYVCLIDYLVSVSKEAESDAQLSSLGPFLETHSGSGNKFDRKNIRPVVLRIRSVTADIGTDYIGRPVKPAPIDSFAENQQNPFRVASNRYPVYKVEKETAYEIVAKDAVTTHYITYIRYPKLVIQDQVGPDTEIEIETTEESTIAVLRRVVAEKDLADERYSRYQLYAQGIIPRNEQPL